jgi:hypothetical protein
MLLNSCSYCHKEYTKKKTEGIQAFKSRKFCSVECKNKSSLKEFTCEYCGKKFVLKASARHSNRFFCNKTCKNRMPRGGIITIKCEVCGKEKKCKKSVPRRFCSVKCRQTHSQGENHYNWKGGITDENTKLRHSTKYNKWRDKVYRKDKWTCQMCKKHCGRDIVAHHIKAWSEYPELRFKVNNGIVLCRACHNKLHHYLKKLNNNKCILTMI